MVAAMYPGAYRLEWARLHDPNHKLTWYEKNIEGTGCSVPLGLSRSNAPAAAPAVPDRKPANLPSKHDIVPDAERGGSNSPAKVAGV